MWWVVIDKWKNDVSGGHKWKRVTLQTQTIFQHFYKLLMSQILTSSNMSSPLISHSYLLIII